MSMYSMIKSHISANIYNPVKFKGVVGDAKKNGARVSEEAPAVAHDVSMSEFQLRYRNLQISCYINILALIAVLIILIISSSALGKAICALTGLFFALVYFKKAFIAWRAREVYKKGESRHETHKHYIREYLDCALTSPVEILPRPLSR